MDNDGYISMIEVAFPKKMRGGGGSNSIQGRFGDPWHTTPDG